MKLVKETLALMNRFKFREDITDTKKLIEKTCDKEYKSRNNLFWGYHRNKKLEELCNSELLKENQCISRKFLPNCNGKESPEKNK